MFGINKEDRFCIFWKLSLLWPFTKKFLVRIRVRIGSQCPWLVAEAKHGGPQMLKNKSQVGQQEVGV